MTAAIHIRADGTWTTQALAKLTAMAAANKSQGTIAAYFEIPKRELETALAKSKGSNPVRLAWEKGRAVVEQDLMDRLYKGAMGSVEEEYKEETVIDPETRMPKRGPDGAVVTERIKVRTIHMSKANTIEALFFAKSQFGWKEGESEEKKVSNVTLVLPKSRTRKEYFELLGIPDPMEQGAQSLGAAGLKTVAQSTPALPPPGLPGPKGPVR